MSNVVGEVVKDLAVVMQKPWFEKHRPEKFEEVVFESETVRDKIKGFLDQGYISGNMLSYGPGGTGKTTINKVLAWAIIKSEADLFILGKSVKDVEDLKAWLSVKAQGSKQKIVIAEEFDRLSKEAQRMLKDGLMERFTPKVAFLCTTNNIGAIDPALLQRFNIKLNFNDYNIDGVFNRCKTILGLENVVFDENEVYTVVQQFANKGIRNLINSLEYGTINKVFSSANIGSGGISASAMEDDLISWIIYMFRCVEVMDVNLCAQTICYPATDATIGQYWVELQKRLSIDSSLNYEYIFKTLAENEQLALFIRRPLIRYYNRLDTARIKSVFLSSSIYEAMVEIYTVKGGTQKLIHVEYS